MPAFNELVLYSTTRNILLEPLKSKEAFGPKLKGVRSRISQYRDLKTEGLCENIAYFVRPRARLG